MSPRIKRIRKILNPPLIKGLKPYGQVSGKVNTEPVMLLFEEYEALRLCDYDMYNHHEASVIMNVSRPTFTRIYAAARQKVAKAFVEGRQISIEGGKVYFDSDWYHCTECLCYFNNPDKERPVENCPLCRSKHFKRCDIEHTREGFDENQCNDVCICVGCGFEQEHQIGMPCNQERCPECSRPMRRKRNQTC